MRRTGDRKMSPNAAFCLGERQIGRPSGLPVLLFTDEEAGSRTRGKQCTEWSRWMLRSGGTPIIPCWHSPVDNGRGAHQTRSFHVANISSLPCLHSAPPGAEWPADFSSVMLSLGSGHGLRSEHLVAQSLKESVKGGLHQSQSTLGCLILITAIHHVGNFLPPHVCFDLLLSGAMTVKDEVPCGRAQTACTGSGAGSQRGALRTGHRSSSISELRKSELANCTAESVTLGEGGIQACWLVFAQGLNRHLVPPRADSSPGAGRGGGL